MSEQYEGCHEPHFVGEENTLFYVDCAIDVSSATLVEVFLQRPDGSKVLKAGTPTTYNGSPDYVYFRIDATDFNQAGKYIGQVRAIIGDWSGWGEKFYIKVEQPISSSSSSSSG